MSKSAQTISRIARQAGVGVETVRYYQRLGLLEAPPKPQRGYRLYGPDHVRRLRFIKRAQALGFTLREIAVLLDLGSQQCAETRQLAQQKLDQVRGKIRHLEAIEHALEDLVGHCAQSKDSAVCPILRAMDDPA